MKLDLGSGPTPLEDHLGLDIESHPAVPGQHLGVMAFRLDRGYEWPFKDGSIEALYSSHFIEHMPASNAHGKDLLALFFEEAWRVAKLGALFTLRWPSLIDEQTGQWLVSAFFDPTHRRFIPPTQLAYFSSEGRKAMGVEHYHFRCNWVLDRLSQRALIEDRRVLEYEAVLRKEPLG